MKILFAIIQLLNGSKMNYNGTVALTQNFKGNKI